MIAPGDTAHDLRVSPTLAGLVLVLITLLAYVPALGGGFVFDDALYVTGDERMQSAGGLWDIWTQVGGADYRHQYYPLTSTAFWVQHRLWGANPAGYHLVNVLLHALNAVLLWRVLAALRVPAAWVAGAVFALHPVHVPSVAWIAELKNVLSACFFLASLLVFVHWRQRARDPRLYALGAALFVAALLSKTATCVLPAALALVMWWRQGRLGRRDLLALAPLVVLGGGFVTMTVLLEGHHRATGDVFAHTFTERCLIAGRAVWFYVSKLLWPRNLSIVYERWTIDAGTWWQYLFPLALAGAGAALWALRRRIGRAPLAATAYFVVATAPVAFANVAFTRYAYVADHWQYWASMGLIALLVGAAAALPAAQRRPAFAPAAAAVALVVLGGLTWQRAHVFRSPAALWSDAVAKCPAAPLAHYNLGVALLGRGLTADAERHFRRAVELDPGYALARNNLGVTLVRQGRLDEAVAEYRAALEADPGFTQAGRNLALALESRRPPVDIN